jgi:MYXO-CTERM domain-containing protein
MTKTAHGRKSLLAAAIALAAIASTPVSMAATEYTWNFDLNDYTDVDDHGPTDYPEYDLEFTSLTSGSLTAQVTAWRYGDSSNVQLTDDIVQWSTGLGIEQSGQGWSESTPWHAIDNYGWHTGKEFLVFDFGKEVALQQFTFGYAQEESCNCQGYDAQADATVLQSTVSTPAGDIETTLESTSLTGAGFNLVGHYMDVPDAALGNGIQPGTESAMVGATNYSRFWAIGTYISNLADSTRTFTKDGVTQASADSKYDAAKLASIVVKTRDGDHPNPSVPVPASLALMGVGGLLLRRRQNG